MKRLIMFFAFMVMGMGALIAASPEVLGEAGDISIASFDFSSLFSSFASFSAGVIVITGFLISKIKPLENLSRTGRSILSWAIAAIVGVVGAVINLGIFVDKDYLEVAGIVFSFAVGSNIIYNVTWIRELLNAIKITPKKREE